jgi:hypothetical protein
MQHSLFWCSAILFAVTGWDAQASDKTIGYVVTSYYTAIHETKYMEECPEGLAIGSDEIWFESLSPADKDRLTQGGTLQPVDPARKQLSYLRGPNGEDVCWYPRIVDDPPMRVVEGEFSYGFDLDGNTDGSPTETTCAHETFTGLDGTPGVDNQLYRLLGCVYGFRSSGYIEDHANRERRDEGQGNILIEVKGVDDRLNDDDVTISFYLANTPLPRDSAGKIIPYSSYRATPGRYGDKVSGKIVDGKLTTKPASVRLPYYGNGGAMEMYFPEFRLDVDLLADGAQAKGFWAGYYDVDSFWDHIQKVQHNAHVGEYNCPSLYRAAQRLADGFPDPATGQCTALSSAFRFEAVAAFIIHDEKSNKQSAAGSMTE